MVYLFCPRTTAFVFLLFFVVGEEEPFSCWAEESKEESEDDDNDVVRSTPVTFASGSATVAKTTIEGEGLR